MDKIHEAFERLDELLRKANSLISPLTTQHTIQWIQDPSIRQKHFEKFPKCYIKLGIGRKHALFPICGRSGIEDPDMITFSLKFADRLYNVKDVDGDQLNAIVKKLKRLHNKFSKDIPHPDSMMALKAQSTKTFNKNMK